ncbi:hypothetical protein N0V82_007173 [Gnomoniopsis sp. IMI 355080]|nr:hypothetical protein N0V82_007173 [Gnomoniopsis sp. IMI 355080]
MGPTTLFADDIHDYYWAPQSNENALNSDRLKYVMLFKDANPRWASDGIIFVKSSLELLPESEQSKGIRTYGVISTQSDIPKSSGGKCTATQKHGTIGNIGALEEQDPDKKRAAIEKHGVDEEQEFQDRNSAKNH